MKESTHIGEVMKGFADLGEAMKGATQQEEVTELRRLRPKRVMKF